MQPLHGIAASFPRLVPWLESLALTLVIPVVGMLFNPDDPYFIRAEFRWLWFGPLLVALRYGIAPALASISLLAALWLGAMLAGRTTAPFPLHFMLGGSLLVLIAGQFSSIWSTRLRRAEQLSRHAEERFQQLSRAYFMVRHSHDRLEQNLISRPVTLRQGMMELRRLLSQGELPVSRAFAGELLVILAHYGSLTSAALYQVKDGLVLPEPLARCGQGATLRPDDLLLRAALESGNTAYQTVSRLGEGQHSSYLVAAPLRSSSGVISGVLLVDDMPFMALHRETLQILGVLLAYAADQVEAVELAHRIIAVYPDCPLAFGAELVKMIHLQQDLDVVSTLTVVRLAPGPYLNELCMMFERQQRGLDHSWRRDLGWDVQFVTLMPFSGPAAMEGYQSRLNEVLQKQFQMNFKSAGISFKYLMLSCEEPVLQLANLLTDEP